MLPPGVSSSTACTKVVKGDTTTRRLVPLAFVGQPRGDVQAARENDSAFCRIISGHWRSGRGCAQRQKLPWSSVMVSGSAPSRTSLQSASRNTVVPARYPQWLCRWLIGSRSALTSWSWSRPARSPESQRHPPDQEDGKPPLELPERMVEVTSTIDANLDGAVGMGAMQSPRSKNC